MCDFEFNGVGLIGFCCVLWWVDDFLCGWGNWNVIVCYCGCCGYWGCCGWINGVGCCNWGVVGKWYFVGWVWWGGVFDFVDW